MEYADRKATQIYVKFPVREIVDYKSPMHLPASAEGSATEFSKMHEKILGAAVVIWTTTPWTIPANRAVSFSSKIEYSLYEISEMEESEFEPWSKPGDLLVVADKLWPAIAKSGLIKSAERLFPICSDWLEQLVLSHPLKNMADAEGKYDFPVPLLEGSHVTADAGTGFVHTAPSHGEDDYVVWISNQTKLEAFGIDPVVPMTLDDAGCYTDVMPTRFQGLDVIRTSGKKRGQDGKANPEVLKALVECGNLLARGMMTLRDAHSWRSKAPVIRRATPQWFISMSNGGLRDKAIAQIEKTKFWPDRGRNRIGTMVADRPDWLISRQRNWGVPITLMVGPNGELHTERDDADAINARILAAVEKVGVDGWFETPLEEFMPDDNEGWSKVTDILDVWFDSGSTHAFCLKRRDDLPARADLYLEGSDQHRGWFQSSLLESCAVYGEAPYDGVLTHGFVVDEKGLKMSKSLGNTMSPEDINKQYGAEIMRIWTASSDWANDLKIGREIIQTNVDAYRKLRNTLRYMIGALDGFDDTETVDYADMPALEKWVLHRLAEITAEHEKSVRDHDHKKVFSTLFNFCTVDLSAFYFDIRKDALYCDPLNSTRRRACRTVMNEIFLRLTTWLAPIMCFTMEEVWQARFPSEDKSVHMELFRNAPEAWLNNRLSVQMSEILELRDRVNETIEPKRRAKEIGSSLEALINLRVYSVSLEDAINTFELGYTTHQQYKIKTDPWGNYSDPLNPSDRLADYLIVSDVIWGGQVIAQNDDIVGNSSVSYLSAVNAGMEKCERSWKYFKGEGEITPRDAAAVKVFEAG